MARALAAAIVVSLLFVSAAGGAGAQTPRVGGTVVFGTHSAADNLWRQTGNLMLAQQLLRHESVATTQAYLHPTRDDLAAALRGLSTTSREGTK